jgi:hypothetical protein
VLTPAARRPQVGSWVDQAGFTVVVSSGDRDAVRLVPGARRLGLVVAHDRGPTSPLADDLAVRVPSAATTVWAHDDGSVLVRATFAPPALLVPADPTRPVALVPEVPGDPGAVHLGPGDRLVVLTAAAFDQAPQVVARLVRGDDAPADRQRADDLRTASDVALLRRLLRHAPSAGGAVLTRVPAHDPAPVPARPTAPLHPLDRRFR